MKIVLNDTIIYVRFQLELWCDKVIKKERLLFFLRVLKYYICESIYANWQLALWISGTNQRNCIIHAVDSCLGINKLLCLLTDESRKFSFFLKKIITLYNVKYGLAKSLMIRNCGNSFHIRYRKYFICLTLKTRIEIMIGVLMENTDDT